VERRDSRIAIIMAQQSQGVLADFRSDTVTRPCKAMYEAIPYAKLGDDVLEGDPTVMELEAEAAEMLGKEAALFMPTGTMANLAAIMTHASGPGSSPFMEMICGDRQHTYLYEVGNVSRIAGVQSAVLPNEDDGTIKLEAIENAIRIDDVHYPTTRAILLENTHNTCGGVPLPASYVDDVGVIAKRNKLALHVDGARIFNAATALDTPASRLCKAADTVSFCLSKGLGSPAGSVLVGPKDFIKQARRVRKGLGGGMRQAGVLAACGLVALRVNSKRLAEDHEAAQLLVRGLAEMPQISVDPAKVKTNIFFFDVADNKGEELCEVLKRDHNILIGAYSTTKVRGVTHLDTPPSVVPKVLDAFRSSLRTVFGA